MGSHGRARGETDTDENEPDLKQTTKNPALSRLSALRGFADSESCTVTAGESEKSGTWL